MEEKGEEASKRNTPPKDPWTPAHIGRNAERVSTNTDPPPVRTYAEAATNTTWQPTPARASPRVPEPNPHPKKPVAAALVSAAPTPNPPKKPTSTPARAVFLHAVPTKYKPGLMRGWIEEDNKRAKIVDIRWLFHRSSTWRKKSRFSMGSAWIIDSSAPWNSTGRDDNFTGTILWL